MDANQRIAALEQKVISLESAESELQRQLDLNRFMGVISSDFISLETSQIDPTIAYALEFIVEFTEVERGYVFQLSDDEQYLVLSHEWCKPGVIPHKGIMETVAVAGLTDFLTTLKRGEAIQVQTASLADTAANKPMLDILHQLDIKSFINIPIIVGQYFLGYIGFDATVKPVIWSHKTIQTFNFTGQMIGNVLYRQATEETLQRHMATQNELNTRLRELSTPIIPILDRIIIVPLIGSIDAQRATHLMRRLLMGITAHRAKVVILDIMGVSVVDSEVAGHLSKAIQAARLKGAQTIVTGVSDTIAETVVDLGIAAIWTENGVQTISDLQTGLRTAATLLHSRDTALFSPSHI